MATGTTLAVAVVARGVRALLRDHPALVELMRRVRWPVRSVVAATVVVIRLGHAPIADDTIDDVQRAATLVLIATVAWLAIRALSVIEPVFVGRFDVTPRDNRLARAKRTKALVLRRAGSLVIILVAVVVALAQFDISRDLGAALLAASGLFGAIAAVAGRSTLGNMISGLQIAFAEPIRLDDVVVVHGEWGNIEEITLTYVVVRLWDDRRLVLPTSRFVEEPFQNWTRTHADVIGTVEVWVDYTTPVDAMRTELAAIVAGSELWDGRVLAMQVTECSARAMLVRTLVSAADARSSWDLRCEVREALIGWLADNHPASLPHLRTAEIGGSPRADGQASGDESTAGASTGIAAVPSTDQLAGPVP
jgi:small-conductance mechanosensitive channel